MKKVICDHAGECLAEGFKGCEHNKPHKPLKDCTTECGFDSTAKCVEVEDEKSSL